MDRVAIFVDAGYLFAQGGAAISGSKQQRVNLALDAQKVIAALTDVIYQRAWDCSLLRIYWYDGAFGSGRPTAEQTLLANLDDVKLRLGFVNSNGEQKGVDSLIVTDLIELARLKSITDAILLSGDEDVRVGVQIAQNYGIRVHLLGIVPSRGSQSHQLLQEADTTTEWNADIVREFLSVRELPAKEVVALKPINPTPAAPRPVGQQGTTKDDDEIRAAVEEFIHKLAAADIEGVWAYWASGERGVPQEFDRRLLPTCRDRIGRDLDRSAIRVMRAHFKVVIERTPRPSKTSAADAQGAVISISGKAAPETPS